MCASSISCSRWVLVAGGRSSIADSAQRPMLWAVREFPGTVRGGESDCETFRQSQGRRMFHHAQANDEHLAKTNGEGNDSPFFLCGLVGEREFPGN